MYFFLYLILIFLTQHCSNFFISSRLPFVYKYAHDFSFKYTSNILKELKILRETMRENKIYIL